MADAHVPQARAASLTAPPPGFRLEPSATTGDACWFRGCADAGGEPLLVRRIDGIPFSVAVRDLAAAVELFDDGPAGVAAPLAVAVTREGRTVAGSAAATSGLVIAVDAAAAEGLADDAAVDVWAIYRDEGLEALADAAGDPQAAGGRLAAVAAVLDRLAAGHGAIDSPALRIGAAGPLVLAVGLSQLEAARRERLDRPGAWLAIAPERCLPPGHATARGDQYALAALWLTARTGRPPHVGDTAEAVVRSKLSDPPGLEGLPTAERDVLARALATAAEERFESCAAFAAALGEAVVDGEPLAGAPAVAGPAALPAAPLAALPAPPSDRPGPAETRQGSVDVTAPLPPPGGMPSAEQQEQLIIPAEPQLRPGVTATVGVTGPGFGVPLAAAPYKPGDLILPGYRLERQLGKGGFGEVWKAAAPGGMSVAIKVIGNLGRKEGAREFRALRTVKNVHHAHIVPIFGVWLKTADGRLLDEDEATRAGERILKGQEPALRSTVAPGDVGALDSLELVVAMGLGDRTLYDALRARDPDSPAGLEPRQLLEWMRQAALAIDHFNRGSVRDGATTQAVQHCDIKPHNMLLVGNVVQVCDFGLARVQGQARATANNILSIAYAAPEMMVRPFNPSPSTDQYSLAVSYYELRTGRLPYGDQPESASEEISAVELMRAKTDGSVELGLVPPLEQRVLLRALALEPANRFGSCEELVDMLESAVEMDRKPPRPTTPFPWLQAAGLAGGGVLAAALLAWMLLRPGPEAGPITPPPPRIEHLPQARAALADAVGGGRVDVSRVERAGELALEASLAGEDLDACKAVQAAVDAVLRADRLLPNVRDDGGDIAGLAEAEAAVRELPESVPDSLRLLLERDLEERKTAAQAAQAERMITAVITATEPEPPGLDAALAVFHRASATLPADATERLQHGLAAKLVARADARLEDHDLRSPETPAKGKTRALEDSLKDLDAAAGLDPRAWQAQDRRGFCLTILGRFPEAIEAYGRALELLAERDDSADGERDQVLRRRAYALARADRYGEAAADYVAAAAQDSQVCGLLWEMKNRAWEAGLYAEAAGVLDQLAGLLAANPDCLPAAVDPLMVAVDRTWLLACGFGADPEGQAVAAATRLLEQVGLKLEAAADEQERLKLRVTRANTLDTLATAYARAGDFAAAVRTIDEAITAAGPIDEELAAGGKGQRLTPEFQNHRRKFERQQTWDEP